MLEGLLHFRQFPFIVYIKLLKVAMCFAKSPMFCKKNISMLYCKKNTYTFFVKLYFVFWRFFIKFAKEWACAILDILEFKKRYADLVVGNLGNITTNTGKGIVVLTLYPSVGYYCYICIYGFLRPSSKSVALWFALFCRFD